MRSARTSCGGLPPCQGCRKPSCNGWGWVLIYTGSLKFRIWRVDRANGELVLALIAKAPAIGRSTNVTNRVTCTGGNKHLFADARPECLPLERQLNLPFDECDQFIHLMDKIRPDLPGLIRPHRATKSPLGPRLWYL